jgi:uncharacterized protein with HEPN domain
MSSRKPDLYVQDILQACDDILNFTQKITTAEDLQNDRRTFLAVLRCLEVIGEAARQMPKSFRDQHAQIPWRETAGLRNLIAHEYFGLDTDIIWDIVKTQVPILAEQAKSIKFE